MTGTLRRQRSTAQLICHAAGWAGDIDIDGRWDEYDHRALAAQHLPDGMEIDNRSFQQALERGLHDWMTGRGPDPTETFGTFCARVEAALARAAEHESSRGATLVVTSAGVVSWIAARLLDGGVEQWIRFNRVGVNASITKIITGKSGTSLVAFNEHEHLGRDEITYR